MGFSFWLKSKNGKSFDLSSLQELIKGKGAVDNSKIDKLFSLFDTDRNGKIDFENSKGEKELESIFNKFSSIAGDDKILEEDEVSKYLTENNLGKELSVKDVFDFLGKLIKTDKAEETMLTTQMSMEEFLALIKQASQPALTETELSRIKSDAYHAVLTSNFSKEKLDKDYENLYDFAKEKLSKSGKKPTLEEVAFYVTELQYLNPDIKANKQIKKGASINLPAKSLDKKYVQLLEEKGINIKKENYIFFQKLLELDDKKQAIVFNVIKNSKFKTKEEVINEVYTKTKINLADTGLTIKSGSTVSTLEYFITKTLKLDLDTKEGLKVYDRLSRLGKDISSVQKVLDSLPKEFIDKLSQMRNITFDKFADKAEAFGIILRTDEEIKEREKNSQEYRDFKARMFIANYVADNYTSAVTISQNADRELNFTQGTWWVRNARPLGYTTSEEQKKDAAKAAQIKKLLLDADTLSNEEFAKRMSDIMEAKRTVSVAALSGDLPTNHEAKDPSFKFDPKLAYTFMKQTQRAELAAAVAKRLEPKRTERKRGEVPSDNTRVHNPQREYMSIQYSVEPLNAKELEQLKQYLKSIKSKKELFLFAKSLHYRTHITDNKFKTMIPAENQEEISKLIAQKAKELGFAPATGPNHISLDTFTNIFANPIDKKRQYPKTNDKTIMETYEATKKKLLGNWDPVGEQIRIQKMEGAIGGVLDIATMILITKGMGSMGTFVKIGNAGRKIGTATNIFRTSNIAARFPKNAALINRLAKFDKVMGGLWVNGMAGALHGFATMGAYGGLQGGVGIVDNAVKNIIEGRDWSDGLGERFGQTLLMSWENAKFGLFAGYSGVLAQALGKGTVALGSKACDKLFKTKFSKTVLDKVSNVVTKEGISGSKFWSEMHSASVAEGLTGFGYETAFFTLYHKLEQAGVDFSNEETLLSAIEANMDEETKQSILSTYAGEGGNLAMFKIIGSLIQWVHIGKLSASAAMELQAGNNRVLKNANIRKVVENGQESYIVKFNESDSPIKCNAEQLMQICEQKMFYANIEDMAQKDGKFKLPDNQTVEFDKEKRVYRTVVDSKTTVEAASVEKMFAEVNQIVFARQIEAFLSQENSGPFKLDENRVITKGPDGIYRFVITIDGRQFVLRADAVEKFFKIGSDYTVDEKTGELIEKAKGVEEAKPETDVLSAEEVEVAEVVVVEDASTDDVVVGAEQSIWFAQADGTYEEHNIVKTYVDPSGLVCHKLDNYVTVVEKKGLDGQTLYYKAPSTTKGGNVIYEKTWGILTLNAKSVEDLLNARNITPEEKALLENVYKYFCDRGYKELLDENPQMLKYFAASDPVEMADGKYISAAETYSKSDMAIIKYMVDQYNKGLISIEESNALNSRMDESIPYQVFQFIDTPEELIPEEFEISEGTQKWKVKKSFIIDMVKELRTVREFLNKQAIPEAIVVGRGEDYNIMSQIKIGDKTLAELMQDPSRIEEVRELLNNPDNNLSVQYNNFVGTSLGGNNYGTGINWTIEVPKGFKGAAIDFAVPEGQRTYGEREFLLQAGTRLKIKKAEFYNGKWYIRAEAEMGTLPHELSLDDLKDKGLTAKTWEERSVELEIERRKRTEALDKVTFKDGLSNSAEQIESMIAKLDVKDQVQLSRIENLLKTAHISEKERQYLTTLVETRKNPPTLDNYTHDQIAAEVTLILRHFNSEVGNIETDVANAKVTDINGFTSRLKSDTSTYEKLYNYMKDNAKKGATLIDALKDVRDIYGMRGELPAGDYTSVPEVAQILLAADAAITPEARYQLLIEAGREAAEFQSEHLVEVLKEQMVRQAQSPEGLHGVRMVNYVSVLGIPILSESQLWDLKKFAMELGVKEEHIHLIDPTKEVFSEEGVGSKEFTSRVQNGYTAFQMNFETKKGDWIEFQCRDAITSAFAEVEHLIYDTLSGKDIIGRHPEIRDLYNIFLEMLDENNLDPKVCKLYRKMYITDYYTYCRAKSLGIPIPEPKLSDYAKKIGKQLGIPDLKIDPRLDAKNLMLLHELASKVKSRELTSEQAMELYKEASEFNANIAGNPQARQRLSADGQGTNIAGIRARNRIAKLIQNYPNDVQFYIIKKTGSESADNIELILSVLEKADNISADAKNKYLLRIFNNRNFYEIIDKEINDSAILREMTGTNIDFSTEQAKMVQEKSNTLNRTPIDFYDYETINTLFENNFTINKIDKADILQGIKYKEQIPVLEAILKEVVPSSKVERGFRGNDICQILSKVDNIYEWQELFSAMKAVRKNIWILIESYKTPYFNLMRKVLPKVHDSDVIPQGCDDYHVFVQDIDTPEKIAAAERAVEKIGTEERLHALTDMKARILGTDNVLSAISPIKQFINENLGSDVVGKLSDGQLLEISNRVKNEYQKTALVTMLKQYSDGKATFNNVLTILENMNSDLDIELLNNIITKLSKGSDNNSFAFFVETLHSLIGLNAEQRNYMNFVYDLYNKGIVKAGIQFNQLKELVDAVKRSDVVDYIKKKCNQKSSNITKIRDILTKVDNEYALEALKYADSYNKNKDFYDSELDLLINNDIQYIKDEQSFAYLRKLVESGCDVAIGSRLSFLLKEGTNENKRAAIISLLGLVSKLDGIDSYGRYEATVKKIVYLLNTDKSIADFNNLLKGSILGKQYSIYEILEKLSQKNATISNKYTKIFKQKYPKMNNVEELCSQLTDESEFNLFMKLYIDGKTVPYTVVELIKAVRGNEQGYKNLMYLSEHPEVANAFSIHEIVCSHLRALEGLLIAPDGIEKMKNLIEAGLVSELAKDGAKIANGHYFYNKSYVEDKIQAKNDSYIRHYDKTVSKEQILSQVKTGDVVSIGNVLHIKDGNTLVKLNISEASYLKLFPCGDRYNTEQGALGDCWLVATLDILMKKPKARVELLKLFSEDGSDIVITLPNSESRRFPNGEPMNKDNGFFAKHAAGCNGLLLLEEAVAFVRAKNQNVNINDITDMDKIMDALKGGQTSEALEYLFGDLGKNLPQISNNEMYEEALTNYANSDSAILNASIHWGTKIPDDIYQKYGLVDRHAYNVEGYDAKNKIVYVINPYNTKYRIEIPLDIFKKYFDGIYVYDFNKV